MKDQRQPTTLLRLEQILSDSNWPDEGDDVFRWLTWTYNFLSARKQYHKKRALTQAMLTKMAKTLLSPDEIARVEQEAEMQLGNLEEVATNDERDTD